MTLAKLHPPFEKLSFSEGRLTGYPQYPGSDCLNGAVIKVPDGDKLMRTLASHHYLLMTGHHLKAVRLVSAVFGLEIEAI